MADHGKLSSSVGKPARDGQAAPHPSAANATLTAFFWRVCADFSCDQIIPHRSAGKRSPTP
jgi:hypothetical protein